MEFIVKYEGTVNLSGDAWRMLVTRDSW